MTQVTKEEFKRHHGALCTQKGWPLVEEVVVQDRRVSLYELFCQATAVGEILKKVPEELNDADWEDVVDTYYGTNSHISPKELHRVYRKHLQGITQYVVQQRQDLPVAATVSQPSSDCGAPKAKKQKTCKGENGKAHSDSLLHGAVLNHSEQSKKEPNGAGPRGLARNSPGTHAAVPPVGINQISGLTKLGQGLKATDEYVPVHKSSPVTKGQGKTRGQPNQSQEGVQLGRKVSKSKNKSRAAGPTSGTQGTPVKSESKHDHTHAVRRSKSPPDATVLWRKMIGTICDLGQRLGSPNVDVMKVVEGVRGLVPYYSRLRQAVKDKTQQAVVTSVKKADGLPREGVRRSERSRARVEVYDPTRYDMEMRAKLREGPKLRCGPYHQATLPEARTCPAHPLAEEQGWLGEPLCLHGVVAVSKPPLELELEEPAKLVEVIDLLNSTSESEEAPEPQSSPENKPNKAKLVPKSEPPLTEVNQAPHGLVAPVRPSLHLPHHSSPSSSYRAGYHVVKKARHISPSMQGTGDKKESVEDATEPDGSSPVDNIKEMLKLAKGMMERHQILDKAIQAQDRAFGPLVSALGLTELGAKRRASWTPAEEEAFAQGYLKVWRDFKKLQSTYLPTKAVVDLIRYYYDVWKIRYTPRAEAWYKFRAHKKAMGADPYASECYWGPATGAVMEVQPTVESIVKKPLLAEPVGSSWGGPAGIGGMQGGEAVRARLSDLWSLRALLQGWRQVGRCPGTAFASRLQRQRAHRAREVMRLKALDQLEDINGWPRAFPNTAVAGCPEMITSKEEELPVPDQTTSSRHANLVSPFIAYNSMPQGGSTGTTSDSIYLTSTSQLLSDSMPAQEQHLIVLGARPPAEVGAAGKRGKVLFPTMGSTAALPSSSSLGATAQKTVNQTPPVGWPASPRLVHLKPLQDTDSGLIARPTSFSSPQSSKLRACWGPSQPRDTLHGTSSSSLTDPSMSPSGRWRDNVPAFEGGMQSPLKSRTGFDWYPESPRVRGIAENSFTAAQQWCCPSGQTSEFGTTGDALYSPEFDVGPSLIDMLKSPKVGASLGPDLHMPMVRLGPAASRQVPSWTNRLMDMAASPSGGSPVRCDDHKGGRRGNETPGVKSEALEGNGSIDYLLL